MSREEQTIPALIKYMKDSRPEAMVNSEILRELKTLPEEEALGILGETAGKAQ